MAFRSKKRGSGNGGNDKYLRLTGLWQSKNNDALWTGRMKADQLEDLLKKVEEAADAGAPMVFSLWENKEREGKRDHEFSLQCFVGDKEESGSSRSSRSKSSGSSRSSRDRDRDEDKDKDEDADEEDKDQEDSDDDDQEDEEKPEPKRKRSGSSNEGKSSRSKTSEKW